LKNGTKKPKPDLTPHPQDFIFDGIYSAIEIIGSSTESSKDTAKKAIAKASKTLN